MEYWEYCRMIVIAILVAAISFYSKKVA